MKVRDWMSPDPVTVGPDTTVAEVRRLLVSRRISALPVVDVDHRLVGVLSTVDCLLASLDQAASAD
ncbi:MAG: CBS domain-containing protein [Actinobacteria bacterium]|nr:CBS domain-containing protein [Actinomycetota bacterium]